LSTPLLFTVELPQTPLQSFPHGLEFVFSVSGQPTESFSPEVEIDFYKNGLSFIWKRVIESSNIDPGTAAKSPRGFDSLRLLFWPAIAIRSTAPAHVVVEFAHPRHENSLQ
jgi:hypothetical protein